MQYKTTNTSKLKAWIISLRLRTLPLALSTIFMGSFLALGYDAFNLSVLIWAVITTLFLQILSNLANDYGDALSGADNEDRKGPRRMIQTGVITLNQMKKAIILTALLSFISGLTLIFISLKGDHIKILIFLLLGLAAIGAAIRYTVGSNPYGYRGLGDLYVFLFFGILGVAGTFFLHTGFLHLPVLLPASAIGLFSSGVLNLNNIRDIESDLKSGKKTFPAQIGRKKAAIYHAFLLTAGWTALILWLVCFESHGSTWLVLLTLPLFVKSVVAPFRNRSSTLLDPELRNLSLATLLLVLIYGASNVI